MWPIWSAQTGSWKNNFWFLHSELFSEFDSCCGKSQQHPDPIPFGSKNNLWKFQSKIQNFGGCKCPLTILRGLSEVKFFLPIIIGSWVSSELSWLTEHRTENHSQQYAPSCEKKAKNPLKNGLLYSKELFWHFFAFFSWLGAYF